LKESTSLSLGGILLGIGIGWIVFQSIDVTFNVFAAILIISGIGLILTSLSYRMGFTLPIRGLIGGLILSLVLTSGLDFINVSGNWNFSSTGTMTLTNIVTTDRVYLEIDNFNGPIQVSTWDKAEYRIDLEIKARGSSQKEAKEYVDEFNVDFDESEDQDQKRLLLKYVVPLLARSRYSIKVTVSFPASASLDLDLDSTNGQISLTNINGNDLKLTTSNGPLIFDNVYGKDISGKTSNGGIEGGVDAKYASLSTNNARVKITISCTYSGEYYLKTSNGDIELLISPSLQAGYDLDLSTSNGNIDIDLTDLRFFENQRTNKKAQTEEFDNKAIRMIIQASTSNANIKIKRLSRI